MSDATSGESGEQQRVVPEQEWEAALSRYAEEHGQSSIVLHRHPGARIETVEIDAPVQIVQTGDALSVHAEGGRRVRLEPIRREPSRS